MSVPEGLRSESRLKVFVAAMDLASHTALITSNPNVFVPARGEDLIRQINRCACDIYMKAWRANHIRVDGDFVNYRIRLRLQEEAISLCDEMLAYIGLAKSVFHLRYRKINAWTEKVNAVQALLRGWNKSDTIRFGRPDFPCGPRP